MTAAAERPLVLRVAAGRLEGTLSTPMGSRGLVVFVHGSGSSRHSSRNRQVAAALQREGLATLLFDLLTLDEEAIDAVTRHLRFDIELLTERVVEVIDLVRSRADLKALPLGLFGASTGAAAALAAAARRPGVIEAVVSRGGRPDLAMEELPDVWAPTLLIVGELDDTVIALNEEARAHLRAEVRLEIVPGAAHLFEEPGALERVASLTAEWFRQHLGAGHVEERPPALI